VLRWLPAGTHDWRKFLKPHELRGFLAGEPLQVDGPVRPDLRSPARAAGRRAPDADVNYMMTVARDAA